MTARVTPIRAEAVRQMFVDASERGAVAGAVITVMPDGRVGVGWYDGSTDGKQHHLASGVATLMHRLQNE